MIRLLCVASLIVLAAGVSAQQFGEGHVSKLGDLFAAANSAASQGDHATAIARYRELIAAGVHDPDLYFNLGTSLAQSGDYPRAIFNYERTLNLRPSDGKASENLRTAEKALEERRAEAEGEASIQRSSSISDALYHGFTEDALAYVLLVANFSFFVALAWAWKRRSRGRGLYTVLVSSAAVLLFSALGLAVKAGQLRDGPRAVVLEDRILLREGPDPRAHVRGEARGADRGEIVGRDRVFVKLRVIGGLEGWVPLTAVGSIDAGIATH
jgi:tetratricopeptide (TPR) repeat protein